MSGPARNGALIDRSTVETLAAFYLQLFSMQRMRKTPDFISLDKDGFNPIIHTPPSDVPNSNFSPIKLLLTVDDRKAVRELAARLGGAAFEGGPTRCLSF